MNHTVCHKISITCAIIAILIAIFTNEFLYIPAMFVGIGLMYFVAEKLPISNE